MININKLKKHKKNNIYINVIMVTRNFLVFIFKFV